MVSIRVVSGLNLGWFASGKGAGRHGLQPTSGKGFPVHVGQGDLDRACGPYAVIIALTILGETSSEDVRIAYKANSRLGRALQGDEPKDRDALFARATTAEKLKGFIGRFNSELDLARVEGGSGQLLQGIVKKVEEEEPVVVLLKWGEGGRHWTVVVGTERRRSQVRRLLLLDPACPSPTGSYWNAVLTLHKSAGKVECDFAAPSWMERGVRLEQGYVITRC